MAPTQVHCESLWAELGAYVNRAVFVGAPIIRALLPFPLGCPYNKSPVTLGSMLGPLLSEAPSFFSKQRALSLSGLPGEDFY